MNKTLTIIRPGESHDDYSWALKLSDAERLSIADQLLRDLWTAAHGQHFFLFHFYFLLLLPVWRFRGSVPVFFAGGGC